MINYTEDIMLDHLQFAQVRTDKYDHRHPLVLTIRGWRMKVPNATMDGENLPGSRETFNIHFLPKS